MRVCPATPPWEKAAPTSEMMEAIEVLDKGNITSVARAHFNKEKRTKESEGKRGPVGMQSCINKVLTERFNGAGWEGKDGRFLKGNTLLYISFRHYKTIGTDFLEIAKSCKREDISLVLYLACGIDSLRKIAPTQAGSMVSFEKLQKEISDLTGIIELPLIYGELIPKSL